MDNQQGEAAVAQMAAMLELKVAQPSGWSPFVYSRHNRESGLFAILVAQNDDNLFLPP